MSVWSDQTFHFQAPVIPSLEKGMGSFKFGESFQTSQLKEQKRQFDERMKLYRESLDVQQKALQGGGGLNSLINEYNQAFAQAKQANEQRYQQQLSLSDVNTGQQRADIISNYQGQRSNALQELARTGLSNPITKMAATTGIEREQQGALNRLADELSGRKIGIIGQQQQNAAQYKPTTDVLQTMAQYLASLYGNIGRLNF